MSEAQPACTAMNDDLQQCSLPEGHEGDHAPEVEEMVPVILAVANGLVIGGKAMFVQSYYEVPISELLFIQRRFSKYEEV